MGTVYKKHVTRPLPGNAAIETKRRRTTAKELRRNPEQATVAEQIATWRDRTGKKRTAVVVVRADGAQRIRVESATYYAKYRDGQGIVCEVPTGCRTKDGALSILKGLTDRAEKVQSKILTAAEDRMIDHQRTPLVEHFAVYRDHQTAKGLNAARIRNTQSRLKRLANECGFRRLSDLDGNAFDKWLSLQTAEGMSPGNRNEYRQELIGFGNWCVKTRRLLSNPFRSVPRADAKSKPNRQRRAMTEAELRRLLYVARWRPLAEYGRESIAGTKDTAERSGKRANWTYAALSFDNLDAAVARARERLKDNPAFVAELERRGRERELIYKTLVLTGLRKGELASITVGQLQLDGELAFLELNAADEKNRQGSTIPLRADLADDVRDWLAVTQAACQDAARNAAAVKLEPKSVRPQQRGTSETAKRQGVIRLFDIPAGLVRILNRDLQAAGIAKQDERGRTLDVHALRYSFATLLSQGGVAPRVAQAAMRHSSINLTMTCYVDPKLLDVHGALDALPELRIDAAEPYEQRATGTDGNSLVVVSMDGCAVAPTVALTSGNGAQTLSFSGTNSARSDSLEKTPAHEKTPGNTPYLAFPGGSGQVERRGVEPPTSALRTQRSPN